MTDTRRFPDGWRARSLSLLLALSLVLGLLGPVSGLPRKDGFIPICTGSEVIYIPLSEIGLDQPANDRPDPVSEHCPWAAQFLALEVVPVAADASAVVYRTVRFRFADSVPDTQPRLPSFQARAPPQRGA